MLSRSSGRTELCPHSLGAPYQLIGLGVLCELLQKLTFSSGGRAGGMAWPQQVTSAPARPHLIGVIRVESAESCAKLSVLAVPGLNRHHVCDHSLISLSEILLELGLPPRA